MAEGERSLTMPISCRVLPAMNRNDRFLVLLFLIVGAAILIAGIVNLFHKLL